MVGMKGNNKPKKQAKRKSRTMRAGAMALLCVAGVGSLLGMAAFNRGVKPNRDMQWYVREGALEVAAPALGEGYASAEEASEFVLPEEGLRQLPTVEPVETLEPVAESAADARPEEGFTPQDVGAEDDEAADPAEFNEDLMEDADEAEPVEDEPEEEVPAGEVTIKISAAGDCTFEGEAGSKGHTRFVDYEGKYGMDYFFSGVRDIFEDDDLTIVNLEGPLTTATKKHSHGFVFKGDPKCVDILSHSSVELCNVANNHSRDYGTEGLKETAQVLDAAGIGYCGYTVAYETTIKGVRICSLGFTKWDQSDEKIAKAVAYMRPNCDLLIVNMHWGQEHVHNQNAQQVATAHAIIDAGADLIIGTHPHVIQGIELYKGKYIVYSLGNFCFAGNSNPEDKYCMIFQQTFSFTPGMGIVQAGILDAGINIIPATVSSVNNINDFQPTVLGAEDGAKVLKALANYCNFKYKDIRWMRENYLQENGLMQSRAELLAAADAEAKANAEGQKDGDAAEIQPEGDAPDDGDAPSDGDAPDNDGAPWEDDEDAAVDAAPMDESEKIAALFADDGKEAAREVVSVDVDEPEPFFND